MSGVEVQLLDLPSHFSQVQLAGLKTLVDHHSVGGQPVQFDARDLERIDGAAVQFLLAVSQLQSAADSSHAIVVNSNDVLNNALEDMGLSDLIKIESVDRETSQKA